MALVPFKALHFDWSKAADRKKFESKFNKLKEEKEHLGLGRKVRWFFQLIVPQFLIVLALYGYVAYTITS